MKKAKREPFCCHINWLGRLHIRMRERFPFLRRRPRGSGSCRRKPTVTIIAVGTGDGYDYTESCDKHVGWMLGSTTNTPATEWRVIPDIEVHTITGMERA